MKSISLTPPIWAGLVTYFNPWNVEEAILCRLQRAPSFHFHSLRISCLMRRPQSACWRVHVEENWGTPTQAPDNCHVGLPVPSRSATWPRNTRVSPQILREPRQAVRPRIVGISVVVVLSDWVWGGNTMREKPKKCYFIQEMMRNYWKLMTSTDFYFRNFTQCQYSE